LVNSIYGSFNFLETLLVRFIETLHQPDLTIKLLEDRVLLFCFFLSCLTELDDGNYWLLIMEVPKFQAKVGIPVVLLEVFEALAVVTLDSGPVSLIDDVFGDVC
jgi:hypothetical protein